jgi:hypothetical protein
MDLVTGPSKIRNFLQIPELDTVRILIPIQVRDRKVPSFNFCDHEHTK